MLQGQGDQHSAQELSEDKKRDKKTTSRATPNNNNNENDVNGETVEGTNAESPNDNDVNVNGEPVDEPTPGLAAAAATNDHAEEAATDFGATAATGFATAAAAVQTAAAKMYTAATATTGRIYNIGATGVASIREFYDDPPLPSPTKTLKISVWGIFAIVFLLFGFQVVAYERMVLRYDNSEREVNARRAFEAKRCPLGQTKVASPMGGLHMAKWWDCVVLDGLPQIPALNTVTVEAIASTGFSTAVALPKLMLCVSQSMSVAMEKTYASMGIEVFCEKRAECESDYHKALNSCPPGGCAAALAIHNDCIEKRNKREEAKEKRDREELKECKPLEE
jgi:hypothetical protein